MARFFVASLLLSGALAANFDFENVLLKAEETVDYPAIRFRNSSNLPPAQECRSTPGDESWPSDADWALFNKTLGGVLLKPVPLAASCYEGNLYNSTTCASLRRGWTSMGQHANHPISVMSQWSSGMSCVPTGDPTSSCTQGGYPVYVVNAQTVRHVQMAVNFARNNNIRLVIKNSGHDFNGKSIGGNSLSIWVHNLKGLTYSTNYAAPNYSGRAIALAGGTQASEVSSAASRYGTTILNAGGPTVAVAGGYFQGAGHSTYASFYGLAADHVLRINAVTADGKFVVADADTNSDLFWAFRGGGGGTFGVVTSVVIRTFPTTSVASSSVSFSTTNGLSNATFWAGIKEYLNYSTTLCDNKGFGYNFIRHASGSNSPGLSFTSSLAFPNRTSAEARSLTRPFFQRLNDVGIPVTIPSFKRSDVPEMHRETEISPRAIGDSVGNTLIASRLFQRANYADEDAIDELNSAIRQVVEEGGYDFHGQVMNPTLAAAGNPNNAVHPAFRTAIMHTQAYDINAWWDTTAPVTSVQEQTARHDRLQSYIQNWRDITPNGGSYMNEGDMQDPEWKQSFFGSNYAKLLRIKEKWDPDGVLWVISGVGSDAWEMRSSSGGGRDGLFTQDGKLCRANE